MSLTRYDLAAAFAPSESGASRKLLISAPGLKVLYLSLMPGQGMPVHNHPGCTVTIQGMVGEATVWLEGEAHRLTSQELVTFSGELSVSPRNLSDAPAGVLISLVEAPMSTP
ncbi:MAG: hypothetical protein KF813_10355 [Trueperaceae bacterium]|nr:hypothetical protein [Trueperaceae bacterium]